MADYVMGIDGGGTSCRAALADASGRVLGRGHGGAANILTDMDGALTSIEQSARDAIAEAGLDLRLDQVSAFLGLAGANIEGSVTALLARLPFRAAQVDTDALIALHGAFGDSDGTVAILGTGSVYISRRGDRVAYTGGWGFPLGDLGGGARIGRALLQECLLVHDGVHAGSALIDATLAGFQGDPARLVTFARGAKPADFGRFAPSVFEAAARGDVIGRALAEGAAHAVDEALDAATATSDCGICLLGGLSRFYSAWIAERHKARLIEPHGDALSGAVALALAHFGTGAHS